MKTMTTTKTFLYFFFLILFSIYATALTDFTTVAGSNKNYILGSNQLANSVNLSFSTISGNYATPIVADLNNDGTEEIIVIDKSAASSALWQIKVFHGNTLTPITSDYTHGTTDQFISNLETADLDDDGVLELYYVTGLGSQGRIHKMIMNATDALIHEAFINTTFAAYDKYYTISCDDSYNLCAVLWYYDQSGGNNGLFVKSFNATKYISSTETLYTDTTDRAGACISKIGHFPLGDFLPGNNYLEMYVPFLRVDDGPKIYLSQYLINPGNLSDHTSSSANRALTGADFQDADHYVNCVSEGYNMFITPPLVYEFDGFSSTGKEIIAGVSMSDNEYKMFAWKADLTYIDSYPETGTANGRYLSNIVPAKAFQTGLYEDFCMMGFNSPDSKADSNDAKNQLLCGSMLNTISLFWFINTESLTLDIEDFPYNITSDLNELDNAIYEVTSSYGNDFSEFATGYGIYYMDPDPNDELYDVYQLFDLPFTGFSGILTDIINSGYEDYIGRTDTALIYVSSNPYNYNCADYGCIESITTNPCYTDKILQNTTMGVNVVASDYEGDDLNYVISMYDGAPYEQNQTFYNQSSGSIITAFFVMRNKTSTGVLNVKVYDNADPSGYDEWEYTTLNVDDTGKEYGDSSCTTTFTHSDVTGEETDEITGSDIENIFSSGIESFSDETGISGVGIWYILLLIIVGVLLYYSFQNSAFVYGVIGSTVFVIVWLIVGSVFSIVPVSHIIVLFVLMIITGAVFVSTMWNKPTGGV